MQLLNKLIKTGVVK